MMKVTMPLGLGVKGRVKVTRTDVRTGEKDVFEKDNLLLSSILDCFFTHSVGLLDERVMYRCYIGTGTQTPTRADAGCQGTVLADSTSGETLTPVPTTLQYPVLAENYVAIDSLYLSDSIYDVAISPGFKYLAYGTKGEFGRPALCVRERIGTSFPFLPAGKHPEDVEGRVRSVSFSPNGLYLAATHDEGPGLTIYRISEDDTFTKLQGEGQGPDASPAIGTELPACAFSPNSDYLAVGGSSSPYIRVYKRIGDAFIRLGGVPALPGMCYHLAWSNDGVYLAIAHASGSHLTIYKRDGDNFVQLESVDPLSDGHGNGRRVAFSHDSKFLAVLHTGGDMLAIYERNGDSFTRLLDTPSLSGFGSGENGLTFAYDAGRDLELLFVSPNLSASDAMRTYWFHEGRLRQIYVPIAPALSYEVTCIATHNLEWLIVVQPWTDLYGAVLDLDAYNSVVLRRRWVFPAGTGTGNVGEVVLRAASGSAYGVNENWVARQIFDPPITKGEFHQLDVEWEIAFTKPDKWTGTFVGGQRDGQTDVDWTITLNNRQLYDFIRNLGSTTIFARSSSCVWFGLTHTNAGTPRVLVGTSNDDSDLALDYLNTIHGEQLENLTDVGSQLEVFDYVPGSFEREFRITFPVTQANGPIGEIVLIREHSSYRQGLLRITFDPPLDKVDTYELHLNFKISLNPS